MKFTLILRQKYVIKALTMEYSIFWRALLSAQFSNSVKFIYSEKATNFCEISSADLSYVVTVKSTVEISPNFVAFSEYMNFKI